MATTDHLPLPVLMGKDVMKTVAAGGGGQGYSSSGHSDTSQHLTALNVINSTDTSRQGSLEAVQAGEAAVPGIVVPMQSMPPAASPVQPITADTLHSSAAPTASPEPPAADPAADAIHPGAAVQQDNLASLKPEFHNTGSPAAAMQERGVTPPAAEPLHPALPPLSALPPPDPSEPPEVHAEYAVYIERFKAGDTLAQRWHRLAEKGKIEDIKEEWEEWQQDLMLQQLQAQIQAADKGRKRKQADSDLDPDAPRQTRNRRAPSNLQDYQVEAPAASGPGAPGMVREDTPGLVSGGKPTAATAHNRAPGGSNMGSDDGDETYSEEHEHMRNGRASNGRSQQQQRPGARGAYRPPPPVVTQQPRGGTHQQQQQQAWSRWQQQQQAQAGQAGPAQDLMAQAAYHMGTALGASWQSGGAAGAAQQSGAAVPNAAAMQAALEMMTRMWGNDPTVLAQHMQALAQQQHH